MAIQTLYDTGVGNTILSQFDGGTYSVAVQDDVVIQGIGDDFTLNYQLDSLNVSFNAGSEAVIGGGFFKVKTLTAITLVPNATIYLCATIDLSQPETGSFTQRTSTNMLKENLNGGGTTRDMLLYIITTSASGVVSVQDRRNYPVNLKENMGGLILKRCTQAEYNSLPASEKVAGHIFFVRG